MVTIDQLLKTFSLLSILAIGGGNALLPTLQHVVITQNHWFTPEQFRNMFSIGQLAPGPNLLMVILLGYLLKGMIGAITVIIAFFVPDWILVLSAHRIWQHFNHSPWQLAIQKGLVPVVIGLMLAGVFMIGKIAIVNITTLIISFSTIAILFLSRINPAIVVILSALIGSYFLSTKVFL